MIKKIVPFLFLVFIFFAPRAFAAVIVSQTDSSSLNGTGSNHGNLVQTLGTGISGTASTLKVRINPNGGTLSNAFIGAFNSNAAMLADTPENTANYIDCAAPTSLGSDYYLYTLSGCTFHGTFSLTFDPSLYYSFQIWTNSASGLTYGSTNPSSYPNGQYFNPYGSNPSGAAQNPVADAYFELDGTLPAPPGETISFLTPPATSTATSTALPDFNAWAVNLSNLSTSTDYAVEIQYNGGVLNNLLLPDMDFSSDFIPTSTSQVLTIPKRINLDYGVAGINAVWNATALLISGSSTASTSVSFVIGTATGTTIAAINPIVPAGTSTTPTTCDPNSDFLTDSLCNLGVFLFSPSPRAIQSFTSIQAIFQNKPPIGYLTAFTASLSGLKEGTSSINLIDASSTAAFSPVFTPLRDGVSWLLWFVLLWWAIRRFKHLEL